MNICADLHTHTIASGHALSTLGEMISQARKLGYRALATTDHAEEMPGAAAPFYFSNLAKQPDLLEEDFLLLKGIEGDLMDAQGTIDVPQRLLEKLDWVVVSLHGILVEPMDEKSATRAWLAVAENPCVDMAGHPEQAEFKFDYDLVTKAFAKNNIVVDMNASSRITRPGNEENQKELARCCMRNGTKIAVNSDAHSAFGMDILQPVLAMLEEIGFPEELVINSSMERLLAELEAHGRPIAQRLRGKLW